MANMPKAADVYKRRFCQEKNLKCARWMVRTALGPQNVPDNLFPNQADIANELIKGKS